MTRSGGFIICLLLLGVFPLPVRAESAEVPAVTPGGVKEEAEGLVPRKGLKEDSTPVEAVTPREMVTGGVTPLPTAGWEEGGEELEKYEKGEVPYSEEVEKKEIEYEERESAEGEPFIEKLPPEKEEKEKPQPEAQKKELPIVADADSVEFDREQNVIIGKGNAVIKYKDTKLTADKITVYMDTGDAYAEGAVNLFREGEFLTGKSARYNFETGEANITDCHAYVQPWYGYGKVVRKISKNEYQVENGYVTTCDYSKPHSSLRAKRIYIYPDDSVIAHDVVMYLYETPVFWSPYAKYSLTEDESPYNLVPGFNSDWGFFLLSAFDAYKTKYVRLTPRVDYRSKHGLGFGLDMDWDLPSAEAFGEAVFYYTHDNDPDYTLSSDVDRKDRYRITVDHAQSFSEDTYLKLQFNKQSDEDFIDDFFYDEFKDVIQRENYLGVTKAAEKYQLSLYAIPRFNDFYTVIQRLPEFLVEVVNQRIGETPFFYQSRSSATYFDYRYSDDPLNEDDVENGVPEPPIPDPIKSLRIDTGHELSFPKKLFKFLNVKPYAGLRQTFYSKAPTGAAHYEGTGVFYDADGNGSLDAEVAAEVRSPEDSNVWRGLFNLGFESSMKVWRVWDYYNKDLKINKLRHVFEPALTYQFFSNATREYPEQVYQFDEFDFFNETSMFTLMLRNALQTKRGEGENVNLIDLKLYLDAVTNVGAYRGWDSRAFADDHYSVAETSDGFNEFFNDLFIDAEFRPIEWQKLDFEIYYRLDPCRLDEWDTDYYIYRNDIVSCALGQRYLVDASNLWTTEFNLQLNDDWAARTYLRFEAFDGAFEEGEWSLFRDLHEWEAAFTVRYKGRDKSSVGFFVLLYLDAYPDIPLETRF
jgi:LPS-assembly protein